MRKCCRLTILLLIIQATVQAQIVDEINSVVDQSSIKAHLTFLASDELRGRGTGSAEIDIAAQYLSSELMSYGVKSIDGSSYFQDFSLKHFTAATSGVLKVGKNEYALLEDFIVKSGPDGNFTGELIFMGYGLENDYHGQDVTDKIVIVKPGTPEIETPINYGLISRDKRRLARKNGAKALIELYQYTKIPWQMAVLFQGSKHSLEDKEIDGMPYLWLADGDHKIERLLKKSKPLNVDISFSGVTNTLIPSRNVIGWIEGTDTDKKDEFLVVSAHYDHVGVQNKLALEDTIYNGARDNALGVVAMLQAAKFLNQYKPKYSVMFLALAAEEKGLLGSQYYVENPAIPLPQVFFNLNADGAGYNDTSMVTVVGLNKVNIQYVFSETASSFLLSAQPEDKSEIDVYDRSDNASFAKKGIPAVCYSPGISAFDEEIKKYYHRPADEVQSLDFQYVAKYIKSFVYTAFLLANIESKPFWTEGDKYEASGKTLYKMD